MKIKEKVEIKPEVNFSKIKGLNNITLANHTMRFEFTWPNVNGDGVGRFDLGERNYYPTDHYDTYYSDCGFYTSEERNQGEGFLTVSYYGVKPTSYTWNFSVDGDTLANDNFALKIYWDEVLAAEMNGFDRPDLEANQYWLETFYPPSYTNMGFSCDMGGNLRKSQNSNCESLDLEDTQEFTFTPSYDVECNDTLVYPDWNILTDYVDLTITDGSEYISFYDGDDLHRGNHITISLADDYVPNSNIDAINIAEYIRYHTAVQTTEPYNAEITAEANGYEEKIYIELTPVPCITEIQTQEDFYIDWIYPMEKVDIPLEVSCYDEISEIEGITFTAEVTEGSNFGGIINPATGRTTNKLTNIEHEDGSFEITFFSNGEKPAEDEDVTITVTASDPEIEPYDIEFYIHPSEFVIKFVPEELKQGDTATVNFYRNETDEGEYTPFPEGQLFNVEIFEGGGYVKLSPNDDDELYDNLTDVTQPVQLIANEDIDLDTVQVVLFAETNDNGGTQPAAASTSVNGAESLGKVTNGSKVKTKSKSKRRRGWGYGKKSRGVRITKKSTEKEIKAGNELAEKADKGKEEVKYSQSFVKGNNNKQTATPVITGTADEDDENWIGATGEINVVSEIEILLGETKYFAVKKKSDEYKIVEIPTEYGDEPKWSNVTLSDGWEWLKEDVWGNKPIEKLGTKSGVYWEKKYPFYIGNKFSEMKDLDVGIIRIVGRYWEQDKEDDYKVKLKETNGNEVILKIIKPNTIGEVYDKVKDVKGVEFNLDEMILEYAGKNGIAPQFIKGIIEKESSFKNAMRWEPFFQVSYMQGKDKNGNYTHWTQTKSRYTIKSETDLGSPGIPTDHINVYGVVVNNYWGYQGSIWDLFYRYCPEFNLQPEGDIYKKKNKSWNRNLEKNWKTEYSKAFKEFLDKGLTTVFGNINFDISTTYSQAGFIARSKANDYAKYKWRDGVMSEIAQTRIATSYGLMQVLYTTATWLRHYPEEYHSHTSPKYLPEYLNEKDYSIKYGVESLVENLNKEINIKNDSEDNNWTAGFERTMEITSNAYNVGFTAKTEVKKGTKVLTRYLKRGYSKLVMKYSKSYLPSK